MAADAPLRRGEPEHGPGRHGSCGAPVGGCAMRDVLEPPSPEPEPPDPDPGPTFPEPPTPDPIDPMQVPIRPDPDPGRPR